MWKAGNPITKKVLSSVRELQMNGEELSVSILPTGIPSCCLPIRIPPISPDSRIRRQDWIASSSLLQHCCAMKPIRSLERFQNAADDLYRTSGQHFFFLSCGSALTSGGGGVHPANATSSILLCDGHVSALPSASITVPLPPDIVMPVVKCLIEQLWREESLC